MKRRGHIFTCASLVLAAAISHAGLVRQAVAQDFYKGKQITVVVGNPAGGGYDTYARLLVRHMGKHIPGDPTFIVQNIPGAGSVTAAQHLMNVAPRDGTTIGTIVPGAIFDPLLEGEAKYRYSPARFIYIGSADSGTRLCFTSKKSGIQTSGRRKEPQGDRSVYGAPEFGNRLCSSDERIGGNEIRSRDGLQGACRPDTCNRTRRGSGRVRTRLGHDCDDQAGLAHIGRG